MNRAFVGSVPNTLDSRKVYDETAAITLDTFYATVKQSKAQERRAADRRAMLARTGEEPNPEPYYCYQMRLDSLRTVHRANLAISYNAYGLNVGLRSAALSYATDNGIVFG